MALAAASKAFRASTFCADVVLTPSVMRATKRTARNQSLRVICLSSWGVEIHLCTSPSGGQIVCSHRIVLQANLLFYSLHPRKRESQVLKSGVSRQLAV